jgi:hypothetical protein
MNSCHNRFRLPCPMKLACVSLSVCVLLWNQLSNIPYWQMYSRIAENSLCRSTDFFYIWLVLFLMYLPDPQEEVSDWPVQEGILIQTVNQTYTGFLSVPLPCLPFKCKGCSSLSCLGGLRWRMNSCFIHQPLWVCCLGILIFCVQSYLYRMLSTSLLGW